MNASGRLAFSRAALVGFVAILGCGWSLGDIPVVGVDDDRAGFKMLRPGAEAESCRASVLGIPVGNGEGGSLEEAIARLLKLDEEANVLRHVRVRTSSFVTGLYNRRCVTVSADVGRVANVVRLPVVGEGHHHH